MLHVDHSRHAQSLGSSLPGTRVAAHGKRAASLLARFLLTAQGAGASGLLVFRLNYFTFFQNKPNAIPTFGIRIASALHSAGIKIRNIQSNSILNIPSWTIKQPEVLSTDKKETTDSSFFRAKFQELSSQYPDFQHT